MQARKKQKQSLPRSCPLGEDIPPPDDDPTAENAALVPINPNIGDTKITHTSTAPTQTRIHQRSNRLQYLYTKDLLQWNTSLKESIVDPENSHVPNVENASVHIRRLMVILKILTPLSSAIIATNFFLVQRVC